MTTTELETFFGTPQKAADFFGVFLRLLSMAKSVGQFDPKRSCCRSCISY